MQVNENEEDLPVILANQSQHVLSLINNRDTKNNRRKENTKFPPVIIAFNA